MRIVDAVALILHNNSGVAFPVRALQVRGNWIPDKSVEGVEGEVITIGLRTTMIRTGNDTIVTIPN
ncbi:MAG: mechanosensitive ion channel, partial [Kofleriaceae bacterium]|nr:mechanosensitive ion channel [Kofleriaceae bacterium]